MKILAVDTASKTCSVAIVDEATVLAEYTVNHKDTHSRFVMDMIHTVLGGSRITVSDLDGFSVTVGPGSFTGLRIGLSTVKGLALATGKPVVGVNSLEVLAYQIGGAGVTSLICPMLDARRSEVYAARYRLSDDTMACQSTPRVLRPEEAINNISEACIFVGDGAVAYKDLIESSLPTLAAFVDGSGHFIRAATIGRIAVKRFLAHASDDLDALKPLYLRKSDAEKNLKQTLSP